MRAATVHTPGRCPCSACREHLPGTASSGGHKERDTSTSREISRASNCLLYCVPLCLCSLAAVPPWRPCSACSLAGQWACALAAHLAQPVLLPGVQGLVSRDAGQLSPTPLMHSTPAQPQSTPLSAPAARADFQGTPRRAEYAGGSTPSSPVAAVGAYPGSPLAGSPPPVAYTSPAPGGLKLAMPCVEQGLGAPRNGPCASRRSGHCLQQAGSLSRTPPSAASSSPLLCLPCHRRAMGVAARCAQP